MAAVADVSTGVEPDSEGVLMDEPPVVSAGTGVGTGTGAVSWGRFACEGVWPLFRKYSSQTR